ncbi:glycosyltransferase family protein [Niabella drilacis]|uniref:Oligosaccharide biosynthesis protein Alg14 like n=1 Tax=Niabella drilacis (strain DSM 25811 / CCM 8410 / CCUG 62505 / LMG 26954 / E90) TaxID=1285928 RepID=A0A1G6LM91_NIADE|nr:oligosaccharide biosynthesis protein Alg14 [Niabella drilacis]SDC44289.1 Oligosaccharide biosynthesis protein Alg14 like [Niabella drilacis]
MSKRILAVASAGGHWVQLLRLMPAFDRHTVSFLSTKENFREMVAPHPFYFVQNATRWNKLGILHTFFLVIRVVREVKPDVIITTGAAPGLLAIIAGRLCGARTLWIDSIANAEDLSLSGKIASRFAHKALTQWKDLSSSKFSYQGNILS